MAATRLNARSNAFIVLALLLGDGCAAGPPPATRIWDGSCLPGALATGREFVGLEAILLGRWALVMEVTTGDHLGQRISGNISFRTPQVDRPEVLQGESDISNMPLPGLLLDVAPSDHFGVRAFHGLDGQLRIEIGQQGEWSGLSLRPICGTTDVVSGVWWVLWSDHGQERVSSGPFVARRQTVPTEQ